MEIIVATRHCDAPLGLEDLIESALRRALNLLIEPPGAVEVFLDATEAASSGRCRIQINMRPYGTVGSEIFQLKSHAALSDAVERLALRARMAVRARASVARLVPIPAEGATA